MEKLKQRSNILLFLFMLIMLILIVRAAILTIATDKRLEANLVVMNRSPQSFLALGKKIEELQQITKEIDNYTLGQIKNTLTTTAQLASNAKIEFQSQYDAWLSVQSGITKDKESFLQLRQQLDEIKRLQDSEIVRLKKLLAESEKPSIFENTLNFVISFVLGVLSSIVASSFYEGWKEKKIRRLKS